MFLPALEREDLGMLVLAGASALLCFLAGCVVHQSFVLRIILGRIEAIERRVMHVKVTNHRSQSAGSDCGDGQRGVRLLRVRSDSEACRSTRPSDAGSGSKRQRKVRHGDSPHAFPCLRLDACLQESSKSSSALSVAPCNTPEEYLARGDATRQAMTTISPDEALR